MEAELQDAVDADALSSRMLWRTIFTDAVLADCAKVAVDAHPTSPRLEE